jgi:DNA-binding transcriptional LysR family regulator
LTVVKHKSVSKAAKELFMSQPAISIQLRNFQSQFDIPLSEIIGRRLHITEFGYEIAHIAKDIIEKSESIESKLLAYKGLLAGKLKMVAVSTGKYILPYFLTDFVKEHSGVELSMQVFQRQKALQMLENNEAEIALVSVVPDELDVQEEILMPNLLFMVGPGNMEFRRGETAVQELQAIYREKGSGTRIMLEKYMAENHPAPKIRLELTSTEAVKQAVIAGLGVSILSIFCMHYELQERNIRILKAEDFPLKSTWRFIWLKDKSLSPVAQAFINHIRAEKHNIISRHFSWVELWTNDVEGI